jgi:hypothetical protein
MRLYLDTEFNGLGGELLSMAIVSDDGQEFYEVLPAEQFYDGWVEVNVVPKFDKLPIDRTMFRHMLHNWLRQFDNPEIIADWHADFIHFFDAFHGRDYTESLDFSCTARLLSGPSDIKPDRPHNALSDAHALRRWYQSR